MEKDQVWEDTEFRFAYVEFEVSGPGPLGLDLGLLMEAWRVKPLYEVTWQESGPAESGALISVPLFSPRKYPRGQVKAMHREMLTFCFP